MAPPPWGSQHPPSPPENNIKSFILNKEVLFLMVATVHACVCVYGCQPAAVQLKLLLQLRQLHSAGPEGPQTCGFSAKWRCLLL